MKNRDEMAAPWLRAEGRIEAAYGPVADALLDRAGLQAGDRVLDIGIASGLSTLRAAQAVGQSGQVTGIDRAASFMARVAERAPDTVTLRVADAQIDDLGRGFTRAISLFGTMFFDDTQAAFANIRTAMVPGGHFNFAAWGPPATNPWLSIGGQVLNEVLGAPAVRADPNTPGPFRFALPDTALKALHAAGWQGEVETMNLTLTPTGTPADIAGTLMELGVAADRIADENPDAEEVEAIEDALISRLRQMQNASGAVLVPARVHFFTAKAMA